jgi:MFS family permease
VRRLLPTDRTLRTLAVGSLVNSAGSGLLITTLVLYFTRIVGLSGGQVALGLSLGAGAGLLAGVPLGHLSDARGPREVLVALLALLAAVTVAYVFVTSFAAFVAVACLAVCLDHSSMAVRQGVIARALPVQGRVRARAFLRSITNVGFAGGAAVATIGIAIDTKAGYQAMILADAASFAVVAAIHARLPHLPPVPPDATGPRLVVLRDRPYLVVVVLTALLALHNSMLDVGLPLWVSQRTDAPSAIVGVIFVLNCVSVALFSVRLAAGSEAVPDAARTALRSGTTLLLACALMAVSGPLPALAASAVLVAGMLLQSVGEMQQAASQWGLSLGLAPGDRHGQYQAAASTGLTFASMVGPLVMAAVVGVGAAGWLVFGAALVAIGAATVPATRWAQASRERAAARLPI